MSLEEIAQINSDDAAGNFLTRQFERQNGRDFLDERQQELTLRKSPNPHISLGVSAAPAEAELTVPSTYQEGINDAGDIVPSNPCTPSDDEPHRIDCRDLTATQLRKKYKHEYESWKNHKTRTKQRGLDVHPQLEKFSDFLACVGPCNGGTLDRIKPSDPEYAPGKVRWADKRTQSVNRRNVRLIQTPDGPKTVPQIANLQKVGEPAIRMRLKNRWSDLEIWAGKRSAQSPTPPTPPTSTSTLIPPVVQDDKAPSIFLPEPDLKSVWEKATSEAFPGEWHEPTASVRGQLNSFLKLCRAGYLPNHAEALLTHTIKNWRRFAETAEDRYGAFGSIPTRPTMAFLLKYLSAAVNLYLWDNNLEFIGTRIQSKAPLPSKPAPKPSSPAPGSLEARLALAAAERQAEPQQRVFRDVEYDPPAFVYEPQEWQASPDWEKKRYAKRYAEELQYYNAEYTAETGKLPPEECRDPSNVGAILNYIYQPSSDQGLIQSPAPAPAKPYIEYNVDENTYVQAYNDQTDADELASPDAPAPDARAEAWREIAAIIYADDRIPARANSPEIDPAEWEETLATMAGWGEVEADCAQPAGESGDTCSVIPLRSQSFLSRFPLLGQRWD